MLQAGQPSLQSRVEPATWAAALSICFNTCSGWFRLWSRATSARAGSLFCPLGPSSGEPGTCQRWQTCTSIILDAVVVLVHFSCCEELPQTIWLTDSGGLFNHSAGGWEGQDQSTSRLGVWYGPTSWTLRRHLCANSHSRRERMTSRNSLLPYLYVNDVVVWVQGFMLGKNSTAELYPLWGPSQEHCSCFHKDFCPHYSGCVPKAYLQCRPSED